MIINHERTFRYTYNFNGVLDWLITRTKLCDLLTIIGYE
jgi:hypothetical protein